MSLIPNERRKLFATFLNNIAVGCVTTGVVAQTFALIFSPAADRTLLVSLVSVIWFLFAVVLHSGAQAILGGLKE